MAYVVEVAQRASRDLERIYLTIRAADTAQAAIWFNGLERAVFSLDEHPGRGAVTPEDGRFRHLLYGRGRHLYRIICSMDEAGARVRVVHIRYGARDGFAVEA